MDNDTLRLAPGVVLGPYRIEERIGAGGMGEVYRARDARIGRDVAIKVLPAEYAVDPDRLRRFEQEARASGALNHPNVLTLYDVGTAAGQPYLVMELLDGETLRDRISRGALTPTRTCEVAADVARGLAAAHAKGIVHRDLKPENIMVTRDGRVKVLDFGIAKLRAPEPDPDGRTVTTPLHTKPQTVIGTAGYMAPEQVRGLPADERADLFALGAIVFEMLTGRRAFDRDSRVETLNAVLNDDPPALSGTPAPVPAAVERIVRRCLEKDPDARFQSARDLAFALDTSSGTAASTTTDVAITRARRVIGARNAALLMFGVAVLAGLAVWALKPARAPATRQLARFALQPPPGMTFAGVPAISPDGNLLVYRAGQGTPDSQRLFLRRLDQLTTAAIPGTEGGVFPFFSPDGQSVGFAAGGKLKKVSVMGTAPPVVVCDVPNSLGGTWTTDGTIIFGSIVHGLQRVSADGGVPQAITTPDPARPEIDHHAPKVLPGGKAVLLTVHEGEERFRIGVLVLATGERKTLIDAGFDPQYSPTGHLVYGTGSGLSAVRFNLELLEVTGAPVKLLDGVATDPHNGIANFTLSSTGTMVFLPQAPSARRTLVWMDRSGKTTPLPIEPRTFATPRLSPDGQQLAVVVTEGERRDIWIYHLGNQTFAPVTFEGLNRTPLWTRDGLRLTYVATDQGGVRHLMWQPTDASAPTESLISSKNDLIPGGWAVDGRSLVYVDDPPTDNTDLRVLSVDAGRGSASLPNIPERSNSPAVSPDGRWLAFVSWKGGQQNINVQPFPGPGSRRQLVEGGGEPVWSRDGREIFFRTRRGAPASNSGPPPGVGIFVVPFDGARGVASAPEAQLFRGRFSGEGAQGVPSYDVTPDGRRFLMVMANDSEFVPIDLNVIMHIDDELTRRVR